MRQHCGRWQFSWVKKTCAQRETLTVAGFALDEGKWDGIYVGRRKGNDLIYAGKVDHGFDKVRIVTQAGWVYWYHGAYEHVTVP